MGAFCQWAPQWIPLNCNYDLLALFIAYKGIREEVSRRQICRLNGKHLYACSEAVRCDSLHGIQVRRGMSSGQDTVALLKITLGTRRCEPLGLNKKLPCYKYRSRACWKQTGSLSAGSKSSDLWTGFPENSCCSSFQRLHSTLANSS